MSQGRFIVNLAPTRDILMERLNHLFTPASVPYHDDFLEFPTASVNELVYDIFNRYVFYTQTEYVDYLGLMFEDPMTAALEPYSKDPNVAAALTNEVFQSLDRAFLHVGGIDRSKTYNINMMSDTSVLFEDLVEPLPYHNQT